jgi:O-antigen/teichoic acid export membrane protein
VTSRIRALRAGPEGLAWVLLGRLGLLAANTVLMLFLATRLPLDIYGLLVSTIGAQILLSRGVLMGVESGIVRLRTVPSFGPSEVAVFTAGLHVLGLTTATLGAVSILGWLLVPIPRSLASWFVVSTVLGSVGMALVDYAHSCHLARAEYAAASLRQAGTAVARLGGTAGAVVLWPEAWPVIFLVYAGITLGSGLLQVAMIGSRFWTALCQRAPVLRLLRYSVWQGAASLTGALSLHQGTFLLMLLGQPDAAGLFGICLTVSLPFFVICGAYSQYLVARVARHEGREQISSFLSGSLGTGTVLVVAGVPATLAAGWLLRTLIRPDLPQLVPIFYVLAASMLVLIWQAPLAAICHYLLRPELILAAGLLRVAAIAAFGLALAPTRGASGAAAAQLAGTGVALLGFAAMLGVLLRAPSPDRAESDPARMCGITDTMGSGCVVEGNGADGSPRSRSGTHEREAILGHSRMIGTALSEAGEPRRGAGTA